LKSKKKDKKWLLLVFIYLLLCIFKVQVRFAIKPLSSILLVAKNKNKTKKVPNVAFYINRHCRNDFYSAPPLDKTRFDF